MSDSDPTILRTTAAGLPALLAVRVGDDGAGIERRAGPSSGAPPAGGWEWCHVDREHALRHGVLERAGVPADARDALLAAHTRPHLRTVGGGLVFVGRGLPGEPGAPAEATVSLRAWLEERRLVTVSQSPVPAVHFLLRDLEEGDAPADAPECLLRMIDGMTRRLADAVGELGEAIDRVHQDVVDEAVSVTTGELAPLRIRAIVLHRYVGPLRDALDELARCRLSFLEDPHVARTHTIRDRVTRLFEDLVSIHSRSTVARDEIVSQQNERLNRRLYGLTVLTAIFLPLTFVTGALGMNLAGIPFAERSWSFGVAVVASGIVVALEVAALRRLDWL